MYSGTLKKKAQGKRISAANLEVRPNYRKDTKWTYGECADWSRLSPRTVLNELSKGKFLRASMHGRLKVDAESFRDWVEKDTPRRRKKSRVG